MMTDPPPSSALPYPSFSDVPMNDTRNVNQLEIDVNDVSFQPINDGYVGTGAMDNAAFPPANVQPLQQQQQQQNNVPTGCFQRFTSFFSTNALEAHFDIDTEDVKDRLWGSVRYANSPEYFMQSVLNKEGKRADLYGPVWITMSCIFLFAVTSNTAKFLHTDSLTDFEYDILNLAHAFSVLLFYTFIIPFVLFVSFKCINVPLSLMDLISLYGYSLVPYIPITIMCLIPSVLFEWIVLLTATGLSLLLILRNVGGPIMRSSMNWSGPIMIGIMGSHFVFCLVLKWTFYRHRYHGSKSDNGSDNMDDGVEMPNDDVVDNVD